MILFWNLVFLCLTSLNLGYNLNEPCSSSQQCNGGSICTKSNCQCPTTATVTGNACITIEQKAVAIATIKLPTKPVAEPAPVKVSVSSEISANPPPSAIPAQPSSVSASLTASASVPSDPSITASVQAKINPPSPTAFPVPPEVYIPAPGQVPLVALPLIQIPPSFPGAPPPVNIDLQSPGASVALPGLSPSIDVHSSILSLSKASAPSLSIATSPLSLFAIQAAMLSAQTNPKTSLYLWPGSRCTSVNVCIGNSFCYQGRCCCPVGYTYTAYACVAVSISLSGSGLPSSASLAASTFLSDRISAAALVNLGIQANIGAQSSGQISLLPQGAAAAANISPRQSSTGASSFGAAASISSFHNNQGYNFAGVQQSGDFAVKQAKNCATLVDVIECSANVASNPCCSTNDDGLSYLLSHPLAAPVPFPFLPDSFQRSTYSTNHLY